MDNSEIVSLIQKMDEDINKRLDKLFELIDRHDTEVTNLKVTQGILLERVKTLEGKSSNTRANIAIAITILGFLFVIIQTVVRGYIK